MFFLSLSFIAAYLFLAAGAAHFVKYISFRFV